MTTELSLRAPEEGIYVIDAAFYDEASPPAPVVPTAVSWKLVDHAGTLIANDTAAPGDLDYTMAFLLSGTDLAIPDGAVGEVARHFRISYTYVSSLGTLTQTAEATFWIENHVAQV